MQNGRSDGKPRLINNLRRQTTWHDDWYKEQLVNFECVAAGAFNAAWVKSTCSQIQNREAAAQCLRSALPEFPLVENMLQAEFGADAREVHNLFPGPGKICLDKSGA